MKLSHSLTFIFFLSLSFQQQVVELSGYVIILVENVDGKIKLYGSPPDRDNLEVGDEILEVNGLTLDNISRTEIIRHIHDVSKEESFQDSLEIHLIFLICN